jgi:hypothetical protein
MLLKFTVSLFLLSIFDQLTLSRWNLKTEHQHKLWHIYSDRKLEQNHLDQYWRKEAWLIACCYCPNRFPPPTLAWPQNSSRQSPIPPVSTFFSLKPACRLTKLNKNGINRMKEAYKESESTNRDWGGNCWKAAYHDFLRIISIQMVRNRKGESDDP